MCIFPQMLSANEKLEKNNFLKSRLKLSNNNPF